MIVPVQILENLKCSNCEDLLSCGPVLLKQDGSDICGRCSVLEETAVPNKPYNQLAERCMFPCKYEEEGCYEKVSFNSMKQHEADCEFRTYICPVMPSGSCDWTGTRSEIMEHTREVHPERILEHPIEMEHDLKTDSLKTFLTSAFDLIFLIHVKICLTTYTIYYSVRKIGEISEENIFKYTVNIQTENGNLIRKEEVAPQECLAFQEETSFAVEINSLLTFLKGLENTKMTLSLQEYMKCYICKTIKTADEIEMWDKTVNIFYCETCIMTLRPCENSFQGCTWYGKSKEKSLHELIFCTYKRYCDACEEDIEEINMLEHIRNKNHCDLDHLFGKYWRVYTEDTDKHVIVSFKNESYILSYFQTASGSYKFHVEDCQDDIKFNFVLILRNPKTNMVLHYNLDKSYNLSESKYFWYLKLHSDKIKPFIEDNEFDVGVDIFSYA